VGRLKILASGNSPEAKANARGKLFEDLMTKVLRHYGYTIDAIPRTNYAGMEIDIEGRQIVTGIPLYAECKCYETEVDSPKLQQFFGKYMTRWFKEKRSQGLFIALPGVNSHAKGFYRDNCEGVKDFTVSLYEEEKVIKAILDTPDLTNPEAIIKIIPTDIGTPGDWLLLFTDKGIYWIYYVIPIGVGIANAFILFNAMGDPISDKTTLDYVMQLYSDLEGFNPIVIGTSAILSTPSMVQDIEEIVEVRGSKECFEYQFPASPEHFIGRQSVLEELDSFVTKIINQETSSRYILFEANSGWGKSSVVLASVARLQEMGHLAVAIDSRTASSSKFILRLVDYIFNKFKNFDGLLSDQDRPTIISGFEGATKVLLRIGQVLKENRRVMFIFLDQFENIFLLPDILRQIVSLSLKLLDSQTNIVLGFSWKSDLVSLAKEFPYQLRDSIIGSSKRIALETFSEVETTALLDRLSDELRAPLRKDLRFFLSEFSQGYPWLLKKLCAHVKTQREAGFPQSDIAISLLNVEELFQEDLRGLPPNEVEVLRRIAKSAPVSALEFGEDLDPKIVQSLVNRRLIISIGPKFDIYWDIFRDYLNTGKVPVQENYILRLQVGSVLKAINLLAKKGGILNTTEFKRKIGLAEKSFYNVFRDMRLLGLAKVEGSKVILQVPSSEEEKKFEDSLRVYLKERLRRNRPVWQLLEELQINDSLTLDRMSDILARSCPYISATKQTWQTYASNFADWMEFADLAIYEKKDKILFRYKPGTQVRERRILARRRGGMVIPSIQYKPIETVAVKLFQAIQGDGKVDWSGLAPSSIKKSLAALEDLGFIVKKPGSITFPLKGLEFLKNPEKRPALLGEGALKIKVFRIFLEILETHKDEGSTLLKLAEELRRRLTVTWKNGTALIYVKVMLDWARYTGLAPGVFIEKRRRSTEKDKNSKNNIEMPLFRHFKKE
jgi:hypothetical protein